MTKIHDLSARFEREAEILSASDSGIICVVDGRGESGNCCTLYSIDADTGKTDQLLRLPGTRLYESFNTYGMTENWFYAVSVDERYHVRLQMIDKQKYQIVKTAEIIPKREVLQIIPAAPDYVLVIEEMPTVYLCQLSTGKKYDLRSSLGKETVIEGRLWHGGEDDAFLILHLMDEQENESVRYIPAQSLIASASRGGKTAFWPLISGAAVIESGGEYDAGMFLHVMRQRRAEHELLMTIDCSGPEPVITKQKQIDFTGGAAIVRSSFDGHVWQVHEDSKAGLVHVRNLSGTAGDFDYPLDDGDFDGCADDDLALTTRYDTAIVRGEPLFMEVQVLHDLKSGGRSTFKGGYAAFCGHLVLKKSFLCL